MSHHAHHIAETAVGAVAELAKRGGVNMGGYHAHGIQRAGELAVRGAAAVAPGAVAVAAHGTAAVVAGTAAVATAAAPFVVVAAAGFAVYKLAKWLAN